MGTNKFTMLGAVSLAAIVMGTPAMAQQAPAGGQASGSTAELGVEDIVVTAQRQSERLQDVPISISALSAENLEKQQVRNALDLQLSLPNVVFSKGNFTASSFTIRGVGDLCVGPTCDTATGIHINGVPVPGTRLFETEYLDLERVEVLRGPQGTLYGRNATSGVVNFLTARPNLRDVHASGSAEYGNYNSIRVQGMLNVPLTDTIGVRFAGAYLKRDGYTRNLFDNSNIDGRDLYQIRGSLRWQPSADTTLDLIGSYFHEKDNRSRIQKQLCHRDPTGVLGCLPDRLAFETVNANATFTGVLSSRQFFAVRSAAIAPFGLRSLYGSDAFSTSVNPTDYRTVNSNVNPTYFTDEINAQAHLGQAIGSLNLELVGSYNMNRVSSTSGFFLNTPDSLAGNVGIATFRSAARLPGSPFANGAASLFDAGGNLCASNFDRKYVGALGGNTLGCFARPYNYDVSEITNEGYSVESHLASDFSGRFNFLIGGIYLDSQSRNANYAVLQSEANYVSAVLGGAATGGAAYIGPPFFNSEVNRYTLKSYGVFGEGYLELTPKLKATVGVRYSNDRKFVRDRGLLLNFPVPYGLTDAFASPSAATTDFDPSTAGIQSFRETSVSYSRLTGRAVIDWKPTNDILFYASYSRGYKSGGINPPFDATQFAAPVTFRPESIDAFELGTKTTLADGMLRLNASAFYYSYKDLQLSRILNRTSFNDNTDATIYGVEVEAVIKPSPAWLFNLSGSYLKTKIKNLSLVDTRDPSGGRSDTVIIKDITTAANCVVRPTIAGNATGANTLVAAVNGSLGLQAPTPIAATNTTGAYSICSVLASTIQNPSAPLRVLFATPTGSLPFLFNTNAAGAATGLPDGVPVDLSGNALPNAPSFKFSTGVQHTLNLGGDMTLITRGDLTYTGGFFARSFNRAVDRIQGYEQINISVQLNGRDDRWFVRGFIQNLTNNGAITGQYVSDPSTGLFTNIFTLEPRRYGVAAGFKF